MKRLTLTTALAALLATGAAADSFSFPAHQPNGYRDTGCDAATRVEIKNDAGKVLYVNMKCPGHTPGNRLNDLNEAAARDRAEADTPDAG